MKFSIIAAALATLAAAAPTAVEPESVSQNHIEARQVLNSCPPGASPGQYRCYANIDKNSWYYGQYIAVCGSDGNLHMISRCNCYEVNLIPYCR